MKKPIIVLKALTVQAYHMVPGELEAITVSPEREAIFSYLAQIGPQRFPEFVLDVLRQVEGHTPVDITDGAGDEGQDILTISPSGERQLTQCKHTSRHDKHFPGDVLDSLFAACIRKNCERGLFVTSSDLTPQAKRYVTDREFTRGERGPQGTLPDINYWNGARIWDRIATSAPILNKWFSGMGQTHGLRSFSFDLVIQRLPSGETNTGRCVNIAKAIAGSVSVNELEDKKSYQVVLNSEVSFTITDSFHGDLNLGVRYVGPQTERDLVNIPLWALKVQVTVANTVGQYDPAIYRDLVVKFVGDATLPSFSGNEWWYLVATTPTAVVFLHDIVEPKVVSVSQAESYVKINGYPLAREKEWVFPGDGDYTRLQENGEDELRWRHVPSGIGVTLLVEQRPHPVAAYENQVRQLELISKLSNYEFRHVSNPSQETIGRVLRIADHRWVVLGSTDRGDLFWAFPASEEANSKPLEEVLERQGISVTRVSPEEREKIISSVNIEKRVAWFITSNEADLVTPVWLDKRTFLLSKEVKIAPPKQERNWLTLVKFKAEFESRHGFDFMEGRAEGTMAGEEITGFLFDPLSIRGDRMLDIAFLNGKMLVQLRVRETSLESSPAVLPKHLAEFDDLVTEIAALVIKSEESDD